MRTIVSICSGWGQKNKSELTDAWQTLSAIINNLIITQKEKKQDHSCFVTTVQPQIITVFTEQRQKLILP